METKVVVIADSVSPLGKRITTLQAEYQRFIHAEFMTHRMFSRNAGSSRATPTKHLLDIVRNEPAMPIHWGKNQPGMQAREENTEPVLIPPYLYAAFEEWYGEEGARESRYMVPPQAAWRFSVWLAAGMAEAFSNAGYHKQVSNRLIEPGSWIKVVVTATDWENFYELRCHPDAQPEFQHLAVMIREAMAASTPRKIGVNEWHLPYVSEEELQTLGIMACRKLSTARCARVSYMTHDGKKPDVVKDIDLHDKLVAQRPLHASPAEHQATPLTFDRYCKNLHGWMSYRHILEDQAWKSPER